MSRALILTLGLLLAGCAGGPTDSVTLPSLKPAWPVSCARALRFGVTPHPHPVAMLHGLPPVLRATTLAQVPEAAPPSRHPTYISRQRAIRQALTELHGLQHRRPWLVCTRLLTWPVFEALRPVSGFAQYIDPHRKFWIVTVHAAFLMDKRKLHVPIREYIHSAYTVAIDAETGAVAEGCFGCDKLGMRRSAHA